MKDRVIGSRYLLREQLGAGGMSTVWSAFDRRLEVMVAVKLLDPAIAEDVGALSRFVREAKTSAQLKSRYVVQSLDCGVDAGAPFIVMELLEGQTLRERLKARGRLPAAETASILSDVARGIQAAHAAGIVHRDLKPENIFLLSDGEREFAKVLDFGIAKLQATTDRAASLNLTKPGSLFGTPNYMSPEQIDARSPVDHRTDIWSLGVVAYECITGRVPFGEETLREQFLAICARPMPIPSSIAAVPEGFDAWFARAAAQDMAARFGSVKEALAFLCQVCGIQPFSMPPPAYSLSPPPSLEPQHATVALTTLGQAAAAAPGKSQPSAPPSVEERPAPAAVREGTLSTARPVEATASTARPVETTASTARPVEATASTARPVEATAGLPLASEAPQTTSNPEATAHPVEATASTARPVEATAGLPLASEAPQTTSNPEATAHPVEGTADLPLANDAQFVLVEPQRQSVSRPASEAIRIKPMPLRHAGWLVLISAAGLIFVVFKLSFPADRKVPAGGSAARSVAIPEATVLGIRTTESNIGVTPTAFTSATATAVTTARTLATNPSASANAAHTTAAAGRPSDTVGRAREKRPHQAVHQSPDLISRAAKAAPVFAAPE